MHIENDLVEVVTLDDQEFEEVVQEYEEEIEEFPEPPETDTCIPLAHFSCFSLRHVIR
jgi:hypothetical protein